MRHLVFVAALLSVEPSAAQEQAREADAYFPQQLTAKDLLFTCAASSLTSLGRERRRYCAGFVSGVEETIRLRQQQPSPEAGRSICVPPGTTARNLADTYKQYGLRSGVDLTQPAAALVTAALQEAFPCR